MHEKKPYKEGLRVGEMSGMKAKVEGGGRESTRREPIRHNTKA